MSRLLACASLCALITTAPAPAADANALEHFERKVRPALLEHCASCHSAKARKVRARLSVDSRADLLKGGESGPALVPGKPDESLLIKAIRHDGELKMPAKGKLPASVIADLERWVRDGAPAPAEKAAAVAAGIDWKQARQFWSFRPVRRPAVPDVKDASWARNGVDRFVLAAREGRALVPVAEADRRALLRRLTFDLTGLPPAPADVEAFVRDSRPDAYERAVERLLASPAHGERWARPWLDVARYAEDQAHTFAVTPYFHAWRYRDWVIDALNADVPYDRFVKLQIAADQMPGEPGELAALGFFGLGAQYYKNSDAARAAADELDDRVDTLARGFLGLTVSCARCHDHKYDPIPTQDYYSLAGVFASSRLSEVLLAPRPVTERYQEAARLAKAADDAVKELVRAERQKRAFASADRLADHLLAAWQVRAGRRAAARGEGLDAALVGRLAALLAPNNGTGRRVMDLAPFRKEGGRADDVEALRPAAVKLQQKVVAAGAGGKGLERPLVQALYGDAGALMPPEAELPKLLGDAEKARLASLREAADAARRAVPPAPPKAHGLADGEVTDMKVYVRGNPATQGALAPRRALRILAGDDAPRFTRGSGRLELAEAIASQDNPLTARVIVNRLWQHHFGRGIVGTPSNFGALGERPTHPELLDWLACELIDSGWSLKHVHRLIVLSATYRLASDGRAENAERDPDNRYLWRMNRRRLEVEPWRDALLAAAGQLDAAMGGPTTDLKSEGNVRRTVYAKVSRHELDGLLRLFDFPDANITSEKRSETTVAQQQLFVLNSPFMVARAKGLAARVAAEAGDDAGRVRRAYELAYGRPPSAAELRVGLAYLSAADAPGEDNRLTRAERYAQALLAANEFLYVD